MFFLQALLLSIFECLCLRPTITGTHGTELPPPFFLFFAYIFIFNKISLFLYYFISFCLF